MLVVVSNGTWRVDDEVRVDRMTLRRSRELPRGRGRERGAYYEALDIEGDVVYRQSIGDPTRPNMEMFDGETITRVETPDRDVHVEVLLPDVPEVATVRLIADGDELPLREGGRKGRMGGYSLGDQSGGTGGESGG
jgi:hypothetical protein